ncbi:hypothetical protein [Sinomonas atrocyanea]|uniref:hypothetical protein n=1 Tax=Sinomonas atrocyanea TaxID=37927 RepID=UPI003D97F98A
MNATQDPDDLLIVDQLLADLDADEADDLRPLLDELRAVAHEGPVPPNRALAALLVDEGDVAGMPTAALPTAPVSAVTSPAAAALLGHTADETADVIDLSRQRERRAARRRRPLAAAVIIAAAALGTAAVGVADSSLRGGLGGGVETIIGTVTGQQNGSPAPARTAPAAPAAGTPAVPPSPEVQLTTPAATSAARPTATASPTQTTTAPSAIQPNLAPSVPAVPLPPGVEPSALPSAPADSLLPKVPSLPLPTSPDLLPGTR